MAKQKPPKPQPQPIGLTTMLKDTGDLFIRTTFNRVAKQKGITPDLALALFEAGVMSGQIKWVKFCDVEKKVNLYRYK